jgi:hypothetical protein
MLFGSLFKIMHWPGASILLILGVFLFCFYFLPAALMNSYREQGSKYKLLYIVTFIVFGIGMMGTLFKIMHWPGAIIFLLLSIPLPFVLFLPVYLYQTREEKKNETRNLLGIVFGLTFLAVFSVLLALNVSKRILVAISDNARTNDMAASFDLSTLKGLGEVNDVKKRSDELCSYIDDLKCELLTASGNNLCEGNKLNADYRPSQIFNMDYVQTPLRILLGEGPNTGIEELKGKINAYREVLLASGKTSPELTELIRSLFDVSPKASDNTDEAVMLTWEQREFTSYQLIIVIDALSQIQSNARLVESELLAMK